MINQLCVAPHCGLPGKHLDGCDGHVEECESDRCDGCCRGCLPARAADGLYLCPRCRRLLAEDAERAAELYEALELSLTGGGRQGEKTSGGKGAGTELNPAAVEARSAIRASLVAMVRLVVDERGVMLPRDDIWSLARFVVRHADWLAAHQAADEHARDLRDLATDSRTWRLAYPSASDRLYIGECPLAKPTEDGSREICGSRLYQLPDEVLVTCRGCDKAETVEWWQRAITGEAGGIVDAYAGAAHLSVKWRRPVDPALVRKWGLRTKTTGVAAVTEVDPIPGRHLEDCTKKECGGCYRRPIRDDKNRAQYQLDQLVACAVKMWGPARGRTA